CVPRSLLSFPTRRSSDLFLALLFNGLTIALFTFYLCADGPRFRRVICSLLPPRTQREVLRAWEIAISKTGGYLYSRALLALFSGDRKSTRLNSSHVSISY